MTQIWEKKTLDFPINRGIFVSLARGKARSQRFPKRFFADGRTYFKNRSSGCIPQVTWRKNGLNVPNRKYFTANCLPHGSYYFGRTSKFVQGAQRGFRFQRIVFLLEKRSEKLTQSPERNVADEELAILSGSWNFLKMRSGELPQFTRISESISTTTDQSFRHSLALLQNFHKALLPYMKCALCFECFRSSIACLWSESHLNCCNKIGECKTKILENVRASRIRSHSGRRRGTAKTFQRRECQCGTPGTSGTAQCESRNMCVIFCHEMFFLKNCIWKKYFWKRLPGLEDNIYCVKTLSDMGIVDRPSKGRAQPSKGRASNVMKSAFI